MSENGVDSVEEKPDGEVNAWEILRTLDPADVCNRAGCDFDTSDGSYALESFGQTLKVYLHDSTISADSDIGKYITDDLGHLSRLSILLYLIGAKDMSPSGHLVKPSDLEGGAIYMKGSHMLPLGDLAEKFGCDSASFPAFLDFLETAKRLGGQESGYGDVSVQLFPFPRIPVVIAVWAGDDEFPARSVLLFDSTCEFHLPPDALWAVAMVSVRVILHADWTV
ncbi:DUF3786 domain-containing protein [Candidatus Latescibacterota bacterium]